MCLQHCFLSAACLPLATRHPLQVVLEVLEVNVKRGSPCYESGHTGGGRPAMRGACAAVWTALPAWRWSPAAVTPSHTVPPWRPQRLRLLRDTRMLA